MESATKLAALIRKTIDAAVQTHALESNIDARPTYDAMRAEIAADAVEIQTLAAEVAPKMSELLQRDWLADFLAHMAHITVELPGPKGAVALTGRKVGATYELSGEKDGFHVRVTAAITRTYNRRDRDFDYYATGTASFVPILLSSPGDQHTISLKLVKQEQNTLKFTATSPGNVPEVVKDFDGTISLLADEPQPFAITAGEFHPFALGIVSEPADDKDGDVVAVCECWGEIIDASLHSVMADVYILERL